MILFLRRPDAVLNPQPWAEDGHIFIQGVIDHSYNSLFMPYAGYLHLIPRVITYVAMQFGLASAPLIMNLSAMIISVFSISYFFKRDFRFIIRNDLIRFLVCISIICSPITEIWLNITNIQWILAVYLTLWSLNLAFNCETARKVVPETALEAVFSAFAFLTCSFGIVFLPFFLAFFVKKAQDKKLLEKSSAIFVLPLIAIVLQSAISLLSVKNNSGSLDVTGILYCFSTQILSWLYSPVSKLTVATGYWNVSLLSTVVLLLSILGILAYNCYRRKDVMLDVSILFVISLYYVILCWNRPSYVTSIMNDTAGIGVSYISRLGARYNFFPLALIVIMIVRNIEKNTFSPGREKQAGLRLANIVQVLMIVVLLVNMLLAFSIPQFTDMHYRTYASEYDPGGEYNVTIPINPPGWNITIPSGSNLSADANGSHSW